MSGADAFLRGVGRRQRPPRRGELREEEKPKPTPGLVSQGVRSRDFPHRQATPDALIREAIARTSGRVGGWERLA
jgi:hypothetical protein